MIGGSLGTIFVRMVDVCVTARRALLALPLLALAPRARAGAPVPPFPAWIGRTAKLRGDGGAARLLLEAEGRGMISVKLLFFCRPLPVLSWRIEGEGTRLTYTRQSAIQAGRIITGEARIEAALGALRWIEADTHLAEFEGFEPPAAAQSCG